MKRAATATLRTVASVNTKTQATGNKNSKKVTDCNNVDADSSSESSPTPHLKKNPLTREFYDKPSLELSKDLLGKVLVRKLPNGEIIKGTIVETEAYPGTNVDEASSSYKGKITEKNKAMFMDPGTAYVYMTYGMYHCINISAQGRRNLFFTN